MAADTSGRTATTTSTSMIGFAARPGTAVLADVLDRHRQSRDRQPNVCPHMLEAVKPRAVVVDNLGSGASIHTLHGNAAAETAKSAG